MVASTQSSAGPCQVVTGVSQAACLFPSQILQASAILPETLMLNPFMSNGASGCSASMQSSIGLNPARCLPCLLACMVALWTTCRMHFRYLASLAYFNAEQADWVTGRQCSTVSNNGKLGQEREVMCSCLPGHSSRCGLSHQLHSICNLRPGSRAGRNKHILESDETQNSRAKGSTGVGCV